MPLYDYAPLSGRCDRCNGRFEVMQRIADAKLSACPECGQACERLISAVALGGKYSLSNSKIESSGLTQYKRSEKGVYEKTAGKDGPPVIFR